MRNTAAPGAPIPSADGAAGWRHLCAAGKDRGGGIRTLLIVLLVLLVVGAFAGGDA